MSLADQLRLVKDYDVYLERCFAQNMGNGTKATYPAIWRRSRCAAIGTSLCTDGGQVENPNWEIALEQYIQYLSDHGIPEDQLYYMTHSIQAALLGLETFPPQSPLESFSTS